MSVRLTTSLSQRLVLTPQLRQRIEMLQMTTLELTDLIQQQLNENPVLEEVATQEEAQEMAEKILDHMASGGEIENFPAPNVEASAPELGTPSSNGSGESETEGFLPDSETEFAANADAEVCEAAECVIGNLDQDGRLNATNEEIAAAGGWSDEIVERARAIVMTLEPVGCGARDVRECLLAQLEARGETERLAVQLIRDHLEELQQHKLPHLSKQIGVDLGTLSAELQFIRTLDPFPG